MKRPLEGITVLEFSQYLASPYAGLRLADLGARVIKVERPGSGDACRQLATKNLYVDGDSLVFHTVNRNKESFAADLKDAEDLERVKRLIAQADVMTHNFRPGVMEKIGLDYERVRAWNPRLVYGTVTGYGNEGPWKTKPGQDLLAQSLSGLAWLTGSAEDPPLPFGLAVADMLCGTHLAQGILALLVRRTRTGIGGLVETSLMESLLDLQFEVLTTHFNDGGRPPRRASYRNAHAYLGAPYGIYQTADGYLAMAMAPLGRLATLLDCPSLNGLDDENRPFERRNEIKQALAAVLREKTTAAWLAILEPADVWCSDVYNYAHLLGHAAWKAVAMEQTVHRPNGIAVKTLRCPIRWNGQRLYAERAAPVLGEANARLEEVSV